MEWGSTWVVGLQVKISHHGSHGDRDGVAAIRGASGRMLMEPEEPAVGRGTGKRKRGEMGLGGAGAPWDGMM